MHSTATLSSRGLRSRVSSSRSRSSTRLARSVSASWWAMCAMRASMRRCSVMSSCVATHPPSAIGWRFTTIERPSVNSTILIKGRLSPMVESSSRAWSSGESTA